MQDQKNNDFNSIASDIFQNEPVVCITLDTDWCLQRGVYHVLGILDEFSVPATIFCTGKYDVPWPHEKAIHPNIIDSRNSTTIMASVKDTARHVPGAIGNRCHRLECNSILYALLPELGICYDSSWPMIEKPNIEPIHLPGGMLELPIFFMEEFFLEKGYSNTFEKDFLAPGLKVMLFHFGHVYHNTTDMISYNKLNSIPQQNRYRPELVCKGYGVGDFFRHVLSLIRKHRLKCATCSEIYNSIKGAL